MKLYKALYNTQGDGFGCYDIDDKPLIQTKKDWIKQLNQYNEMDGYDFRYKLSDWDNLDDLDWRGIVVKEVKEIK